MTITSKLVIPFLLFCFFAQSVAFAAESTPSAEVSNLPAVHILPDNPLYFLKTLKEKAQLLVTRNASGQADLILGFAQKRLAEALKVAEKGKVHISEKLLEAFGQDIRAAQGKIAAAKASGERTYNLLVKLQETVAYQKSIIEELQKETLPYSAEVRERVEALNSFLVDIDASLGEATESAKMETRRVEETPGLGIGDWLRSLFGKGEILKPLAE